MYTRSLVMAAAVSALAVLPPAANARPLAMDSDPKPGSVLKASPTAIRITFTEGLSRRSDLTLMNSEGESLPTLPPSIGGRDDARLVVPLLAPLAPGIYTVTWRAFSDGSRRARGKFKFEIAP